MNDDSEASSEEESATSRLLIAQPRCPGAARSLSCDLCLNAAELCIHAVTDGTQHIVELVNGDSKASSEEESASSCLSIAQSRCPGAARSLSCDLCPNAAELCIAVTYEVQHIVELVDNDSKASSEEESAGKCSFVARPGSRAPRGIPSLLTGST